jgi:hypothetical protein
MSRRKDRKQNTQSDGITRRTESKAGSSQPSKPSRRRKSRTVVKSTACTPDVAELETQIKKTASEGGEADTSTKSTLPEPDEQAQVDAGGPVEDGGEASADTAAESARDDDEAKDPDATKVAEEQLADEQWLASLRVRRRLADKTLFDTEALLWRRIWPEVERMIGRLEAHRPELHEACVKGRHLPFYQQFARQLNEMIRFPDPTGWHICRYCKGKGRKGPEKAPCIDCGGGGFSWKWT